MSVKKHFLTIGAGYEAPAVNRIDIAVEQGFAASPANGGTPGDLGERDFGFDY